MITEAEYKEIKSRYDMRRQKEIELGCVKKSGWTIVTKAEQEILKPWYVSNNDVSAMEVYEFCTNIPNKYFTYVKYNEKDFYRVQNTPQENKIQERPHCYQQMFITTWTGETLGVGRFTSRLFTDNFGGQRITFTVKAINGKTYHGTFYYSSGDYGRMRLAKNQ